MAKQSGAEPEKHIYKVYLSGYICVKAKHTAEAVKIVRNWAHKVVTEAEGDEPYNYDLYDAPLVHIEPDHNHPIGLYQHNERLKREFEEMQAEAQVYRKKRITPDLPKKVRDRLNGKNTE